MYRFDIANRFARTVDEQSINVIVLIVFYLFSTTNDKSLCELKWKKLDQQLYYVRFNCTLRAEQAQ